MELFQGFFPGSCKPVCKGILVSFLEAASQSATNPGDTTVLLLVSLLHVRESTPPTMAGRAATSPSASPPMGEQFAEVVVVRHGETSWNASHTIQVCPLASSTIDLLRLTKPSPQISCSQGQMDPELNETGRRQARVVRTLSSHHRNTPVAK